MDPRGSSARARRRARPRATSFLGLAALMVLAAACSRHPSPAPRNSPGATVLKCGQARTSANVPVDVEVVRGGTSCAAALAVERGYAEAIRSGKEPGNGGGGPVKVRGWTCQGFATPVLLATGKASKCVRHGSEILAILPPATPASSPSASSG